MTLLTIGQIIVSIIIVTFVLLQERSSGLSGIFGGGGGGSYQTRRGLEKRIFQATILFVAIFALLSIVSLFYHG